MDIFFAFLVDIFFVALYYLIDFVYYTWQVTVPILIMAAGYMVGAGVERRHFASLDEREKLALHQPIVTFEEIPPGARVIETKLVAGSAVIAFDRFKFILGKIRNFFGGPVLAYEGLLDRARREAMMRLRQQALGASEIVGLRIVTADITGNSVEAVAFGTAIYRERP